MAESPFKLTINCILPNRKTCTVVCDQLLRDVPGKRQVYKGSLLGNDVLIKIFSTSLAGKTKLLKEWQGFKRLNEKGFNVPKLYSFGKTKNGRWIMVIEYINNSSPAISTYYNCDSNEKKLQLVEKIGSYVAKLNEAGIMQKDLHLGNFLFSDDTIYALDPTGMAFHKYPLDRPNSLQQLATVSWYIPEKLRDSSGIYHEYANHRGWQFDEKDTRHIKKYLKKHMKKEIDRQLKKSLRTSTRYIKKISNNTITVSERYFYEAVKQEALALKIDELMDNGDILKLGNTCYVSRVNVNGFDTVIKRYNHKSIFHSFRHTIKKSRARHSWLNAHRLTMLGINTPEPLCYIERYKGKLLWNSYIITKYIPGKNLNTIFNDQSTTSDFKNKSFIEKKVKDIIASFHANRLTHGDLKGSNILIADGLLYITDLDAMIIHKTALLFANRKKKDIDRLKKMF